MNYRDIWVSRFYQAVSPILSFIHENIQELHLTSDQLEQIALERANQLLTCFEMYERCGQRLMYIFDTPELLDKLVFTSPQMHAYREQFLATDMILPGNREFACKKFDLSQSDSAQKRYLTYYCEFVRNLSEQTIEYLQAYKSINNPTQLDLRVQYLNAIDHFVTTVDFD